MRKYLSGPVAALLCSLCRLVSFGEQVVFDSALTNTTGWTYSDDVKIYVDPPRVAYFAKSGATILSPGYKRAVTSFTLTFKATSATTSRPVRVVPVDADGAEREGLSHELTAPLELSSETVEWPTAADVRRFAVTCGSGTGTVQLHAGEVALAADYVPAPGNPRNAAVYARSFRAAWDNPEGAVSNLLDLVRVDRVPDAWTEVEYAAPFDQLANAGGNPQPLAAEGAFGGCEFVNVFAPARSEGVAQVGTGENHGSVALPALSSYAGVAVRFCARRYNAGNGQSLRVEYELAGATNLVYTAALELEDAEFSVPLDDVPAGASVRLATAMKTTGRFLLGAVSLVSGFEAAHVEETVVAEGRAVPARGCRVGDLRPESEYRWRVRAVDAGGNASEPSAWVEVLTGGAAEPYGGALLLR